MLKCSSGATLEDLGGRNGREPSWMSASSSPMLQTRPVIHEPGGADEKPLTK